jgi:hypothetical protein
MHGEDGDLEKIVAAFDTLSSSREQPGDQQKDLDEELRAWAMIGDL